jgi:hypothetical protein
MTFGMDAASTPDKVSISVSKGWWSGSTSSGSKCEALSSNPRTAKKKKKKTPV